MVRKGVFFKVRPGVQEEYKRRHDNCPAELIATLKRAGISDYTIWNLGEMLFGCYQVEDEAKCDEVLAACPVYAKWREEMEQVVYVTPGTGQKEWPMELMFLME